MTRTPHDGKEYGARNSNTPYATTPNEHGAIDRGKVVKDRSQNVWRVNFVEETEMARREVIAMLWEAFLLESERAILLEAGKYLGKTDRMIRNYLGGHADAP